MNNLNELKVRPAHIINLQRLITIVYTRTENNFDRSPIPRFIIRNFIGEVSADIVFLFPIR